MKNRLSILVISTIALSSISTSAFAKDGKFVIGSIGYSPQILSQFNNGGTTVYGVGFGLNKGDWSFSVTADSRAYTTQYSSYSQQINSQTLLANAVYNFKPVVGKINFYLGGGYGFARFASSTNDYYDYSSLTTVMQVQFGVKMPVSKNLEAFADIRDSIKYSINGYPSFNIGGKYNF